MTKGSNQRRISGTRCLMSWHSGSTDYIQSVKHVFKQQTIRKNGIQPTKLCEHCLQIMPKQRTLNSINKKSEEATSNQQNIGDNCIWLTKPQRKRYPIWVALWQFWVSQPGAIYLGLSRHNNTSSSLVLSSGTHSNLPCHNLTPTYLESPWLNSGTT